MPLNASIIIPFHQNLDHLGESLAAVRRSMPNSEVIIAADAATEDCRPLAEGCGAHIVAVQGPSGPAVARNRAAAHASGDLLVFVDSDVVVTPDALPGMCRLLEADPGLAGVFGAYDRSPRERNFMSQYKNLSHAYVHETGSPRAFTFWTGLGAVRAAAFRSVGGFDERFRVPSIEDIELGSRLAAAGCALRLDARFRGQHLKRWTLGSSIVTEVMRRGIPWVQLLYRTRRVEDDLNITVGQRLSALLAAGTAASLVLALWQPAAGLALAAACLGAFVGGNLRYYRWFAEQRGAAFACAVVPAHLLHHLCNVVSVVTGTAIHVASRLGVRCPGAIPAPTWSASVVSSRCTARTAGQMTELADARHRPTRRGGLLLLAAAVVAVWVGARGITDEGTLTGNDAPRYAMDGVFLLDVLGSDAVWTPSRIVDDAERYFARYPALSLGLHPPLWPAVLVPFYAAFGVSVFAARLAVLVCFLLSVVLLYTLARRLYDEDVAGWAVLLFASHPFMAYFGQRVLSEMLAIALVLAALNALVRFCDLGARRDFALFILAAVASCAARQIAVLLAPAYLAVLANRGGRIRLMRRDVILVAAVGALLMAPLAVATLVYSHFNVRMVAMMYREGSTGLRPELLGAIMQAHGVPVLGVASAAGVAAAVLRRDGRLLVPAYWILSVILGVLLVTGPMEPDRYSILALPAFCLCAASLLDAGRTRPLRGGLTIALLAAVSCQLWWTKDFAPRSARGYEDAARFVLAEGQDAPTVLYSASIDTGAFVFFVRKHDPGRRLVVLRADKILTTSLMSTLNTEDRIGSPEDIYPLLDRYGTRLVVIEDQPSSKVLDWLRNELQTDRFIERHRLPSAPGRVGLVVYEYRAARPAHPDAVIDMKLPLVRRVVRVRLADLQAASVR